MWTNKIFLVLLVVLYVDRTKSSCLSASTTSTVDSIGDILSSVGATSGPLQISLIWYANQDLDLEFLLPNGILVSFNTKNDAEYGATLDIDNRGKNDGVKVENIYLTNPLNGTYRIYIDSYYSSGTPISFTARMSLFGEITDFNEVIQDYQTILLHEFNINGPSNFDIGSILLSANATTAPLQISLIWFNDEDLDLQVLLPNGNFVTYKHKTDNETDAHHQMDDRGDHSGAKVENVYILNPINGNYTVTIRLSNPIYYIVRVNNAGDINDFEGIAIYDDVIIPFNVNVK